MRYTLKHILATRYDPNRNQTRRLTEIFIPFNMVVKFLSPYPTYLFLNLGLGADAITFLGLGLIIAGSVFFILGHALLGAVLFVCFGLFDSVDGDMARCSKRTIYGGQLDSFGADLFYSLAPLSTGYFLFTHGVGLWGLVRPELVLLGGALGSISFLFYRLINAKVSVFSLNSKIMEPTLGTNHSTAVKEKIKSAILKKMAFLFRHVLLRGNFFGEPGMILWFFILAFFRQYDLWAAYLLVIFFYNLIYLLMNFVGTYIYFRNSESKRSA